MTIGERIKKIRNDLDMSQVDFANKIDVSKQTLYKYENNIITNIPSDKIEAAARLGNVTPAYLMGWETPDYVMHLNAGVQLLVEIYNSLPELSKKRLLQYASSLSKLSKLEEPVLNAAHERTDIETTDDMKKHDDDIMDDENF